MFEARPQAALQTRQSMVRVWLALSAVWVAFWLALASFPLIAGMNIAFSDVGLFAVIVTTPPLVVLAVGALSRWIFETLLE